MSGIPWVVRQYDIAETLAARLVSGRARSRLGTWPRRTHSLLHRTKRAIVKERLENLRTTKPGVVGWALQQRERIRVQVGGPSAEEAVRRTIVDRKVNLGRIKINTTFEDPRR